MPTCTCPHTRMCMHIICACTCTMGMNTWKRAYAPVHMHTCTRAYSHVHTHVHVHVHRYAHLYTHTLMRMHRRWLSWGPPHPWRKTYFSQKLKFCKRICCFCVCLCVSPTRGGQGNSLQKLGMETTTRMAVQDDVITNHWYKSCTTLCKFGWPPPLHPCSHVLPPSLCYA